MLKKIKNKSFKFNKIKSLSTIYTNKDVIEYLDKIHQHIKSNYNNVHISIRSLKHTIQLSKALALINGKEYVTFQEIKDVLPYILRHRLNIVEKNDTVQFIKNEILSKIHVPNEV